MASSPDRKVAAPLARQAALLNTLIVAGGYFLSRVLGLVREAIISNQFGTSLEISAYRAAFTIPDLIYLVVAGGALGSAFIPIFSGFVAEQHEEAAWRLASAVFNWMCISLLAASVLIVLLAEPLVALTVGSGYDRSTQALIAVLIRLLMVQVVLLGIAGLGKATLESFDRFTLPALGSNLYNLGIIGGALLLAPTMGIYGLVWGVIAGAALFVLVQLPGLLAVGLRYTPVLKIDDAVRQVARLLGPRVFGQSALQLNMIAIVSFASQLGESAAAANSFAFQLMTLPHGLIALSLGTVIFPQLARFHAAGNREGVRDMALRAVRGVLFLALPASVALAALRLPILRLLFEHGEFTSASTELTASALLWYALGLAAFAAAEIVVRTFYAMRDTRTPVIVGIGAVVVNIALAWGLTRLGLGLGGLALAFSVANILEAATLLGLLSGRVGGLGAFWGAFGRMVLSTFVFGGVLLALLRVSQPVLAFLAPGDTFAWRADALPLAIWLAFALAIGGLVYAGIGALLRLDEVGELGGRLSGIAGRLRGGR